MSENELSVFLLSVFYSNGFSVLDKNRRVEVKQSQ